MSDIALRPSLVPASGPINAEALEKVLLQGDLVALKPQERVAYYRAVCESVGLNPLTKPFEYISLNGKLTLYATRACTEQLRKMHNVSVTIRSREAVEGCYVVTALAKLPTGREDESIGAVPIDTLKGEAKSNAMMKAETKAKRRVTLSICGLAFLDESETDSVRGAYHMPVSHDTGELPPLEPAPTLAEDIQRNPPKSTTRQQIPFDVLKYFADIKGRFHKIGKQDVYYDVLKRHGVSHANEFFDTNDARACYKEMQLVVADMETASIDAANPVAPKGLRNREEWPDDPEAPALGLWIKVAGMIYYRTVADGPWKTYIPGGGAA